MAKTNNDQINTCPFLGLNDDNTSHMAFTSPENHCYHCKPIAPIKLEHQNDYCLDPNFLTCSIFTDKEGRRMPNNLIYIEDAGSVDKRLLWAGLILAGIAVAISLFFAFENTKSSEKPPSSLISTNSIQTLTAIANASSLFESTATSIATDSIILIPNTETILNAVTATTSPFPTLTPVIPTSNSTEINTASVSITPSATLMMTPQSPYSLDAPIGRGQLFIIHKVANGENLTTLADTFNTSVEAILAVNYMLNIPIRVDATVIIPLQKEDTQGLSLFEPYQVTHCLLYTSDAADE